MKGNKKGFTLIELLAVIVILAIIALIAVPVIMNILDKANKSAFKDTAYGIISAGELYFAEQQLELDGMRQAKTFNLPTDVNRENGIQIKGEVPNGRIMISTEGKIALKLSNGRYCITKGYDDTDITIIEGTCSTEPNEISLGDYIYFNPVENEICENYTEANSATGVKTGCMKWYVYKMEENNVGLILDHNTTAQVAWITLAKYKEIVPTATKVRNDKGSLTLEEQLATDTTGWAVEADVIDAQDIFNLLPWYQELEDKTEWESQYLELNDAAFEDVFEKTSEETTLTADQAAIEYFANNYSNIVLPSYMTENLFETCEEVTKGNGEPVVECVTEGYWTKTPVNITSNEAWYVSYYSDIYSETVSRTYYGLRPVITLSKSLISQ